MSDLAVATDDHEVEWSGLTAAEVAETRAKYPFLNDRR